MNLPSEVQSSDAACCSLMLRLRLLTKQPQNLFYAPMFTLVTHYVSCFW